MSTKKIPTIAEKIDQQIRDIPKKLVTELGLDNSDGSTLDGLTDDFENVEIISLINCQITSLEKFPALPNLKIIDLSSNNISTGLKYLNKCQELAIINISDNPISDFNELSSLKDLENLSKLIVSGSELTNLPDYANKIFELLPRLTFVDHLDKDGNPDPVVLELAGGEDECDEMSLDDFLELAGGNDSNVKDECCDSDKSCGAKRKCDNNSEENVKKRRSD
ncbi:Acidic leucine-rich nuclear phosphoprotein 32 family member A [Strongyloides ratti]|uniref:Acidic leucine-rich nuclear phosphoprotein 32 family member A n=1 Tax=Strongyloides ratti TaxID=34506 RepID=A0A090MXH7_STRRB|nr:Acidic leucine-rich nuclear phosphoprotein 32 family member A [Strongyloides ratti]CEF65454.1 Acidic leucine-rich nuclear phosphoprotein 32 family member A [Strongyloides ratti]